MIQPKRPNHRYHRAMRLQAELMHRLAPLFDQVQGADEFDLYKHAARAIHELLMTEGVEVMTDADRQQAGLPPRGPDGWTMDEMLAFEKYRLEWMIKPRPMLIPWADVPPKAALLAEVQRAVGEGARNASC